MDVGADIFQRGQYLSSDNKMPPEEHDMIINILHRCFNIFLISFKKKMEGIIFL